MLCMHFLLSGHACALPRKKVVGGGSTGESRGGARESILGPVLFIAFSAACPPASVFPRVQEPKSAQSPTPMVVRMVMEQGARVDSAL